MRVNRAFAVGRAEGPSDGLALLDQDDGLNVRDYPYVHLVRGALLEELGRNQDARDALVLAHQHARNNAERAEIAHRLATLDDAMVR